MNIFEKHEIFEIEVLEKLKNERLIEPLVFGGGSMLRLLQAPYNTFAHVPELLNPDFKAVKSPDIRFGVSNTDSFHGSFFTQGHFYLVFYLKFANNIFVCSATNGFL